MALVIYGSRKARIGSYEVFMYECPYCQENNSTIIDVMAKYFHIFWVPIFPYNKEAVATCTHCNTTRDELRFGPKLLQDFRENKNKIRYPWWTFFLPAIILMAFFVAVIIGIISGK